MGNKRKALKRLYAWVLAAVMTISLMSNQFLLISMAEGTNFVSANSDSAIILGDNIPITVNQPTDTTQYNYYYSMGDMTDISSQSGSLYKVEVPAGEKRSITFETVTPKGDTDPEIITSANIAVIDDSDNYLSTEIISNTVDSHNMSGFTIVNDSMDASKVYYFILTINSTDENGVKLTSTTIDNISMMPESDIVSISSTGNYGPYNADKQYKVDNYGNEEISFGILVKVELNQGEGYTFNTTNADFVYVYDQNGLGTSMINQYYGSFSLYNGKSNTQVYYLWMKCSNTAQISFEATDISMVSDNSLYELKLGEATSLVYKSEDDLNASYYYNNWDMNTGEQYTDISTVYGDVYKLTIPANSMVSVGLEYTGEPVTDYMNFPSITMDIVTAEDYRINSLSQSATDSETSHYYNIENTSTSDMVYYCAVRGMYQDGDFEISATQLKSIDTLVSGATDITGKTTYEGTISKDKYSYPQDNPFNPTGTAYGQLLKVTVGAGETVTYDIIDEINASVQVYENTDTGLSMYYSGSAQIININNSNDVDKVYYCWIYSENTAEATYSLGLPKTIADIKDSATVIDGVGEYTGSVSDASYYWNNNAASSFGTLFAIKVKAGQCLCVEGTGQYDGFSNCNTPTLYSEDSLSGEAENWCYGEAAVYNLEETDTIKYLWIPAANSTDENGNYYNATVKVSELTLVENSDATEIPVNSEPTEAVVENEYVGYVCGNGYGSSPVDIDVMQGKVYKVTLPAQTSRVLDIRYGKEILTGYDYNSGYKESQIAVRDIDNSMTKWYGISKYSDHGIYMENQTSPNEATCLLENISDSEKVYYIIVSDMETDGDVELSCNSIPEFETLKNKAIEISEYNTYSGDFDGNNYAYTSGYNEAPGVSKGKLAKITLDAGETVQITTGYEQMIGIYTLSKGNFEYETNIYPGENGTLAFCNVADVSRTFYIWMYPWSNQCTGYSVTTSKCEIPFLKEAKSLSTEIQLGENILKYDEKTSVLVPECFVDKGGVTRHTVTERQGGLYYYMMEPMSTVTVELVTGDATSATGPNVFYGFDASQADYQLLYEKTQGINQTSYEINNFSSEPKELVLHQSSDFDGGQCTIKLSSKSLLPEDDLVYVYSWNDELETRLEEVYKVYPELKNQIKYVNLNCSGTGEYVDYVKAILETTKGNSVVVAMDIDVISQLKTEKGFVELSQIGFDESLYDNAYDYTVEMGSYDGQLKFLTTDSNPGCFIYNTKIAEEILGTSNPDEVQMLIGDSESFFETAELMKSKGYYMTSGEDTIANIGRYTFNPAATEEFAAAIGEKGYSTGSESWSGEWYDDMLSGKVFGFFASPWYAYYVYQYTDDIEVAMCDGPVYYPWGGTFLGIASDGTNVEKDDIAVKLIEALCCDETVLYNNTYKSTVEESIGYGLPNNQVVADKLIEDGVCSMKQLSGTQDPIIVWDNVSDAIGKGEWERKCTDKKYLVYVDSKNQICLDPSSDTGLELEAAGFVYDNLKAVDEENASFDETAGVLTVKDLDKTVRYTYVENGISRELQFVAVFKKGNEEPVAKVEEEVNTAENGDKTTVFVEVSNGEIVGQVDEIEINNDFENTSIKVTENKDIESKIVSEASVAVSQEKLSEDALSESMKVVLQKNEEYVIAAEEDAEANGITFNEDYPRAEINKIEAEFTDDTNESIIISKDFIGSLDENKLSLDISKMDGKTIEYKWSFDKDSFNNIDNVNDEGLDTKISLYNEDEATLGYENNEDLQGLVKEEANTYVASFGYNGELPGDTTVLLYVGDSYEEGDVVYYYHYVPKDGTSNSSLDYTGSAVVDADGYISIVINHCSDYVLTDVAAGTAVDKITIDASMLEDMEEAFTVGDEVELVANITPSNASIQDVEWSSSDETVVTISKDGVVTAVGVGKATITALAKDGSGVTSTYEINVAAPKNSVTSVSFDAEEFSMVEGDSKSLNVTVSPDDATNKAVQYTTSDENVATVDESGKIVAVGPGEAVITVTTTDGTKLTDTCKVTVAEKIVIADSVTFKSSEVMVKAGGTANLVATVRPIDARNKELIWTSSDEKIATVDQNGKVTGIKRGTVTITATSKDNTDVKAECKVTVSSDNIDISKIELSASNIDLKVGDKSQINVTVNPSNATNQTISWTSSDEKVATVDENGNVTAVGVGTATITATTTDGTEISQNLTVKVEPKTVAVSSVTMDKSSLSLKVGETGTLKATANPSNATNPTINWTSSDTKVATVDKNGKVTAVGAGTATIKAHSADNSKAVGSCTVTVTKDYKPVDVNYITHVQYQGWQGKLDTITGWASNGKIAGTSGMALRLEGIKIVLNAPEDVDLGIQYTTHCQDYGWLPWSSNGDMSGTEGESKRLEAIMIKLTGADADAYEVHYRVHAQDFGWLNWAQDGEPSGTAGKAKRLEAIQIVVVKKGESFNTNMSNVKSDKDKAYYASGGSSPVLGQKPTSNEKPVVGGTTTPNVSYKTHVQNDGWQKWKYNGAVSGTTGRSLRLEGINIKVSNLPYDGGIAYKTHIQDYGWESDWKTDGEMSGTEGKAKRLEAICIKLTGEMAERYDVYYRVHAQNYGWLNWASNGEMSGTAGKAYRLEGIQIVLVPKGEKAPANNYGGITSDCDEAFYESK
ncbi:MAG: Ig-like domain-containing protein [Lachnospiraceae bacterium]|nr:Ig-like domain-containing protein [Lachnospiraceae bacterium]